MPGTYDIQRDGRRVVAKLFKSEKEILDFIKELNQPGDYKVFDVTSLGEMEGWGLVTHKQNGEVIRLPFPEED